MLFWCLHQFYFKWSKAYWQVFFFMAVGFLKIKRHSYINVSSVLQLFVLTELFGIPVVFRITVKVVSG